MTSLTRSQRLCKVLENSFGTKENPWISKEQVGVDSLHAAGGDGVSISGAKDIFSRRGRRNNLRGNPIDGFECLLKNLDRTTASKILIHQITDSNGREYRVFTDLAISELVGILRFPLNSLGNDEYR